MAVMKVIEVLAQSEKSWEDAAQSAVKQVSKTVHGVQSIYIESMQATVEKGKIVNYRIDGKVTFKIDQT